MPVQKLVPDSNRRPPCAGDGDVFFLPAVELLHIACFFELQVSGSLGRWPALAEARREPDVARLGLMGRMPWHFAKHLM